MIVAEAPAEPAPPSLLLREAPATATKAGLHYDLAVDPIDGGSVNYYDYAAQDPVNGYDLDGLASCCTSLGGSYINVGNPIAAFRERLTIDLPSFGIGGYSRLTLPGVGGFTRGPAFPSVYLSVPDVPAGATPERVGTGSVDIYGKAGDRSVADADFDARTGHPRTNQGGGTVSGPLKGGGGTISVRDKSGDGRPTLQINRTGKRPIKVRYGKKS